MAPGWLERETARAPEALRARARVHLAEADATTAEPTPEALARSGRNALDRVLAHGADRSVALDLLAADALVTLALLAQADMAPDELGDFAARVLRDVSPRV